jgi:hypothetical protein
MGSILSTHCSVQLPHLFINICDRSMPIQTVVQGIFFCGATTQIGPGPPQIFMFLDHTQLDTYIRGRTPLNQWSARRRGRYLRNTQQTEETNIHALSGIRTRDPSKRAAADLGLRLHATAVGLYSVLLRFNTALLILKQKYLDFNPWRERRVVKWKSEGGGEGRSS